MSSSGHLCTVAVRLIVATKCWHFAKNVQRSAERHHVLSNVRRRAHSFIHSFIKLFCLEFTYARMKKTYPNDTKEEEWSKTYCCRDTVGLNWPQYVVPQQTKLKPIKCSFIYLFIYLFIYWVSEWVIEWVTSRVIGFMYWLDCFIDWIALFIYLFVNWLSGFVLKYI